MVFVRFWKADSYWEHFIAAESQTWTFFPLFPFLARNMLSPVDVAVMPRQPSVNTIVYLRFIVIIW